VGGGLLFHGGAGGSVRWTEISESRLLKHGISLLKLYILKNVQNYEMKKMTLP
jgi:hypothetical protein